jgi:hypothetical protein
MKPISLAILLCLGLIADAQTLTVIPATDLKVKRETYERAGEAWQRNEPNLEAELFKQPAEIVIARIERAATLAATFSRARQRYYRALIDQLQNQTKVLQEPALIFGPDGAVAKVGLEEKLKVLASGRGELERALAQAPNDGRGTLIREQIQQQMKAAEELRNNLEAQEKANQKIESNAEVFERTRRVLAANYEDLRHVFERELERAQSEDTLWRQYYEGLLQAVIEPSTGEQTTAKNKTRKKTHSPRGETVQ